MSNLRTIFIFI